MQNNIWIIDIPHINFNNKPKFIAFLHRLYYLAFIFVHIYV